MPQFRAPPRTMLTQFRRRPLAGLGALILAGGALCSTTVFAQTSETSAAAAGPATADHSQHRPPDGEGEGAVSQSLINDDAAYLTRLHLILGHLEVGVSLYREGYAAAALTHMKHPADELYAALVPAFAARGVPGFSAQLETLATAVADDAGVATVEDAFAAVTSGIDAAVAGVPATAQSSGALWMQVVVNLMRAAAAEYAIAVVDGRLENAHEYQDALGFTRVARSLVEELAGASAAAQPALQAVIKTARNQLGAVQPLWVGVMPPDVVDGQASTLYGAAARVELAASAL